MLPTDAASAPPSEPSSTGSPPPIDESIEAVSASRPSDEAATAMELCGVAHIGTENIVGMGRIMRAQDAWHYVPLTGREPELQTSSPAWIITFRGEVNMPRGQEVWLEPTCMVIDGQPGFYATGPVILPSGAVATPLPATAAPDRRLPPLAP